MIDERSRRKAKDAAERAIAVCDVIAQIVKGGEAAFRASVHTQWAAEMGLIRIGEAVAKVPPAVRDEFSAQPWRQIIEMRNFAAHQYDDLDAGRVWGTLRKDVPALRDYLKGVLLPGLAATAPSEPR